MKPISKKIVAKKRKTGSLVTLFEPQAQALLELRLTSGLFSYVSQYVSFVKLIRFGFSVICNVVIVIQACI